MARIVGGHDASIALHQRCGFDVVGTEREVGRKFGKWLDVVLMERLLQSTFPGHAVLSGVPRPRRPPCDRSSAGAPSLVRLLIVTDSFPRQQARTQRFTLGAPRNITVAPDGSRVAFLRSTGPEDAVTSLWVLDVASGEEHVVADPRVLLAGDPTDLPPEERVRRERARESAAGITGYAADADHRTAVAALAGQLVVADLVERTAKTVVVPSAVIDPRPDPTGARIAWVDGRQLWVLELRRPVVGARRRR